MMKSSIIAAILRLLAFILLPRNGQPKLITPEAVDKILVFGYTGLGNFILYTPALLALKKRFPRANFTLMHGNDGASEAVFGPGEMFNDYIVVKRNERRFRKVQWLLRIRRRRYSMVVADFHSSADYLVFITVCSGASFRIGHVSSDGWVSRHDWIHNFPVRMKSHQHEIERYLALAATTGIDLSQCDTTTHFHRSEADRRWANAYLYTNGINPVHHRIVSVQIGSGPLQQWKQWGAEKFTALSIRLLENDRVVLVFHGSPRETEQVKSLSIDHPRALIAAGKTTLQQVAALIELSALTVCNDSGLMHVSAAVGTPVVALYGPTDHIRTAPAGKGHLIIRKKMSCSPCFKMVPSALTENCPIEYRCLKDITVNEVYNATIEMLNRRNSGE